MNVAEMLGCSLSASTFLFFLFQVVAGGMYAGSVDWWAFGIILYEMLFAQTPFQGEDQIGTFANIADRDNALRFPKTKPTRATFAGRGLVAGGKDKRGVLGPPAVSACCRHLLALLLHKDRTQRLQSPAEIKAHPWFAGGPGAPRGLGSVNIALVRHQAPPIVPNEGLRSALDTSFFRKFKPDSARESPYTIAGVAAQ